MFFIKFVLLPGGFPESDEVVIFSFLVLPHLKNDGVQVLSHPTDHPVLLGPIGALVKVVWVRKDFLRLFESDASFRVLNRPLLRSSKRNRISITVIPRRAVAAR
jgi:hypothetical protein